MQLKNGITNAKKKKGEETKRQLDHEAHNTLMPAHVMANISLL